jgi:hypothetical protein
LEDLDSPVQKDEKRLRELVRSNGSLFRRGVLENWLDDWKQRIIEKRLYPTWVRAMPEAKREGAIRNIRSDDVFRSQFRTEREAKPSALEVITWGLGHIDRLYQAEIDIREKRRTL